MHEPNPSLAAIPSRRISRGPSRDEIAAENTDPYALGWDAGANLDEPPPCPFESGLSARLWRQGFSARVDEYIARRRSAGGLNASLT